MRKIFKYPIKVADEQEVMMPSGAEILSCQEQFGVMCLWALVEPELPVSPRIILIMGTGALSISDNVVVEFIDTVQPVSYGGGIVWHIFEVINES